MANNDYRRFVAFFDYHFGYELVPTGKKALHDPTAMKIFLDFVDDFQPDVVIAGGDILDCGPISHHNSKKPGKIEGLRLLEDAQALRASVIDPLENLEAEFVYIVGNHEDWIEDLAHETPGLTGLVTIKSLLRLDRWNIIPQGEAYRLGKLWFFHGDQIRSGEYVAKTAVTQWERNVRFGHHHTYQAYTKVAPTDRWGHTGIAVPCLCHKSPKYGEGASNRWVQGFCYGVVGSKGFFSDHIAVITKKQCYIEGQLYKGE